MQSVTTYFLCWLATLSLTSCGKIALQFFSGKSTAIEGLNSSGEASGFTERCGAKTSDFADPNFVILNQHMKSTPIIMSGVQSGLAFKVTIGADVDIKALSSISTVNTSVKVVDITADDEGRFSRPIAEKSALENSNVRSSWGMSTGLLLKLQKTDPNFLNVECAVGFTAKSKVESTTGVGVVTFDPGIPTSINPKASSSTFATELGATRSFVAAAKVEAQAKDWAPAGTTGQLTVTFKKIDANVKTVPGMPASAPALDADLAYEVLITAQGKDVNLFGLSKRTVYFVNTKTHTLMGVMDDSAHVNPLNNKTLPATLVYYSP